MSGFITFIIIVVLIIQYFLDRLAKDSVNAYAAQAAFFVFISFFPFLMLLLTLLKYLPFSPAEIIGFTTELFPESISSFIGAVVNEISEKATGAIVSITSVTALWSCSKSVLAIIQGLNSVYGVKERRNYIKLRFTAVLYMIVFIVIILITLAVLVFGSSIMDWLTSNTPALKPLFDVILSLRWVIGFSLLVLFFMFMYTVIPERKTKFVHELPGALVTALGWLIFSAVYSFYIQNFASGSYLYGSLSVIVFLMLWLYFCMYIMFVGAEINDVLCDNNFPELIERVKEKRKLNRSIKAKTRKSKKK